MRNLAIIILIALGAPGESRGHSFTPPLVKSVFYNGKARVAFEARNVLPDAEEFHVQVFLDSNLTQPLTSGWEAFPQTFTQFPGDETTVRVVFEDVEAIKGKAYVCTTAGERERPGEFAGMITRICNLVKFYKIQRPTR